MPPLDPRPRIRVRTPHLTVLTAALDARDHTYEVLEPDLVRVHDLAPDDLGWLAASAGVVVYEMTPCPDPS
ncbi:MAG TPA: hypothetical protein VF228_25125 [Iamia sp.]